jgi:lactoylglutathione lyase
VLRAADGLDRRRRAGDAVEGKPSEEEKAMMKLNHLNLTVTDVAETRKLFETYFGFTGSKEVGNEKFALLFGEDGFVLNLMRGAQVSYPETFHLGFVQESEERVNEINRQLKEDGFAVEPPRKFHGGWTFYFRAPDGFLIEVLHQPQVIPVDS